MDRLSAMALLVKVTELGSMSAAARALNMPLTTVSRHIGELESALGVRLLARTTRKLTLTDAGVDYVAAARRILEEVENAERQATGEYQEPKGELVISAPTMFGRQHVLTVISEFIARYPLIRVRLLLSDRNADLVSDHVDLAVRIGDLADSSMVATRLGTMRIVACAHPALLAKYGEPQRPRDLAALPIIRIESPMPYRGWRFRAAEREDQLINLPPVLSVTTPESAADAARLGVGVARLLHYQALDGLRHGELRLLLETSSRIRRRSICCIPLGIWRRLSCANLSILPHRRCVRHCCASPGPLNASRSSAAPPLTAMRGQTPPP